MKSSTLLPWVQHHKFALATLTSFLVGAYGFYTVTVNDHWWWYLGMGLFGMMFFGAVTLFTERGKTGNTTDKVIGGVSIGVGALAALVATVIIIFVPVIFMLIFIVAMSADRH